MQNQTVIRCSSCGQPVNAQIYSYIDASQDPQAKGLLITGQLNGFRCPQCGVSNQFASPLLYHDPEKELLITHVPMELNLTKDQQERVVGDLLNAMPKDNFKGYMFNPRRALTLQGMIDQILEADGITPEMMKAQKERVQLVQNFVTASEAELYQLIEKHDDAIDMQFFQTLTLMIQRAVEEGQMETAQHINTVQGIIAERSTYGQKAIQAQEEQQKIMQEVADSIQQLGNNASITDFLTLAVLYADDEQRLPILVNLARPAFSYDFFQLMSEQINNAQDERKQNLITLRDRILQITKAIDEQSRASMQNAAKFLQAILNQPQPDEFIRENIHMIDDTFMAVLSANIEQAQKTNNKQAVTMLQQLYQLIVNILQEHMQPELRFINDLLSIEDEAEALAHLEKNIDGFDDELFEVFDAVEHILIEQDNVELTTRLRKFRTATQKMLQ